MNDLETGREWTTRRLPTGEVELTVRPRSSRVARRRRASTVVVFLGATALAMVGARGSLARAALCVVVGCLVLLQEFIAGRPQVWRFKRGMAVRRPGQRDEAAYFVPEVRLEVVAQRNGRRRSTLTLVTPAQGVEVGHPNQGTESLRALGQVVAEALEAGFSERER